jgi:sugar phosphate isomerase/epimerase
VDARAVAGLSPIDRLSVGHYMLRRWSLADDVRALERLGFRSISLATSKVAAYGSRRAVGLLRASSLEVAHVSSYGRFGAGAAGRRRGMDDVRRGIAFGHEVGARVVAVLSGPRRQLAWDAAAGALADAYAALVPEATAAGLRLAIEVVHPLRQDLAFVNTLAAARTLARRGGPRGGYVLDVWHSAWEPAFVATAARDARRRIHAVQLSDVKPVTLRSMDRALLGRGIAPLAALVGALERGGYRGFYELEIIGDDVERLGYERVLATSRRAFLTLLRGARRGLSARSPRSHASRAGAPGRPA